MQVMLACSEYARSRTAYAMTSAQRNRLLRSLLREHPVSAEGRFACYRISGTNRYSDIARSVECEVFEYFFGDTPAAMERSYGPYEEHSEFFLVIDLELEEAAGALRFIQNSEYGLKTLNDIQEPPLALALEKVLDYHHIDSPEQCWDVGTMAVRKPYRGEAAGHYVGTALYGLFHTAARSAGIDHAIAVLDGHAYRQLTRKLAVPFVPIAGSAPFEYLGAKGSRAAYLSIPSVAPSVESYIAELDEETRTTLRPSLARVVYCESVPEPVPVE